LTTLNYFFSLSFDSIWNIFKFLNREFNCLKLDRFFPKFWPCGHLPFSLWILMLESKFLDFWKDKFYVHVLWFMSLLMLCLELEIFKFKNYAFFITHHVSQLVVKKITNRNLVWKFKKSHFHQRELFNSSFATFWILNLPYNSWIMGGKKSYHLKDVKFWNFLNIKPPILFISWTMDG